jgi:hypothetical protein
MYCMLAPSPPLLASTQEPLFLKTCYFRRRPRVIVLLLYSAVLLVVLVSAAPDGELGDGLPAEIHSIDDSARACLSEESSHAPLRAK